MKFAIVLVALFAVAMANSKDETVRSDFENIGYDGYKFGFETSGGLKREESAVVNNLGSDAESISIKGSYSYLGDDGQTYTVNFVADEGGFQPVGDHLPKAL